MKFRRALRPLVYLWVFPTSLLGLLALVVGSVFGKAQAKFVEGVLEVHGTLIAKFLRNGTFLPGGASAMTLGHVVIGLDQNTLDRTRAHERVHVRQCERWGPLFVPAYLLCSLYLRLRGRDAYYENPFEREAFENTNH